MKRITKFKLPIGTADLYQKEARSSIGLAKEVADKINELVDAYNEFSQTDLKWKQEQEGRIKGGIIYMKDNLVNSLYELLKAYDLETVKATMNELFEEELSALNKLRVFVTPQMFGAVGDGTHNDIEAIEKAIAALNEGDILFFPEGAYLMTGHPVTINKKNVTFAGPGLIKCDYGFRPKASDFNALGLRMEGISYSTECRAFSIDNSDRTNGVTYSNNFVFKDCSFKNFFYAVSAIGGAYNFDGTESDIGYPVRDLVIENCYSTTYTEQNAGHFQSIQVENISYINNRTFGGQNASSYNAIKGNGFIRIVGNYDHNNSYASAEVENGSGKVVIANNTFNSKIWIDDSFDVIVNANTTEAGISVTVGSNVGNAENIVISNNACKNIRCEQFGTYEGGLIKNVNINSNNVNGNNTHGIWIHGNAVTNAKVSNNFISGTNTNDIAIQRNEQLTCYIQGNFGNGNKLLIAGTGGMVYAVDNYNLESSGTRDSLFVSHLEREFNGIKVADTNGEPWRINVSTSGTVTTTKY